MAAEPNPYLKVYDAVAKLLFAGPLASMIAKGNRVTYGTDNQDNRNLAKDRVASADAPELLLIDEGGSTNLHINSSGMEYNQSLAIYVSTGDFRYANYASIINWWITCNLTAWKTTLGALTWNGKPFVKNITVNSVQIGESNPERNRGFAGWTDIWRISLMLRIANEDIIYREVT